MSEEELKKQVSRLEYFFTKSGKFIKPHMARECVAYINQFKSWRELKKYFRGKNDQAQVSQQNN